MPAPPKGALKKSKKKNVTTNKKDSTKEKPKRQNKTKDKQNKVNGVPSNSKNIDCVVNTTVPEKPNAIKDQEPENKLVIKRRNRPQLGMQTKKEDLCHVCEKPGEDLLMCTKGCFNFCHIDCVTNTVPKNAVDYVCELCAANKMVCFICGKDSSEEGESLGKIKRCTVANCGKAYHTTCIEIKMVKYEDCEAKSAATSSQFRCPLHFCDTCMIKSSASSKLKLQSRSRYFKCVRCPTAYHIGDDCIAAGSVMLAGFNIICPVHFTPKRSLPYHHPIHVSWCFTCSQGGKLICCASCPAAFHVECTGLQSEPEGDFYCRDCSHGIRPLYGDLVWIKLGTYRWWPGEVVHPLDIPDNIMRLRHDIGEFVVQFLGSRDYFWLNRYRIFIYQDGDANGTTTKHCSKGISTIFKKALEEAEELFALKTEIKLQLEQQKIVKNDRKPAPYKHIKVNRPVGKVQINTADIKEIPKCSCRLSDPKPCSGESECINHMLLYECHPELCPAADRCENQRFQKCLYPKFEVFKTSWGGWGLKAMEAIKKGSFVNEYVGELVDEEECRKRIEKAHANDVTNYYMLTIDKDRIIDAGPKGNHSRFMNHSCDPNCETQKWTVNGDTRVGLFAKHDIKVGDELTFNYNLDCLGNDKTTCKCGARNCSGYIGERPKPQLQNGTKKDASKKKKRVRRLENIPQHEDLCFRCRNTGMLLVCCDYKDCLKAFCLECLHITKPPYGKWECPWHHCDWCGRKAQYFCHFCPNSFCTTHVTNQLKRSVPSLYDCCLDHNPETAEFELAEAVNLATELANMPEEPVVELTRAMITELPNFEDETVPEGLPPSAAPIPRKQSNAKPKTAKRKSKPTKSNGTKSNGSRKRKCPTLNAKKETSNLIVNKEGAERCVTAVVESPNVGGKRRRVSKTEAPPPKQTNRRKSQKQRTPDTIPVSAGIISENNQNGPSKPLLDNSYEVTIENENGSIKSVSVKSNIEEDEVKLKMEDLQKPSVCESNGITDQPVGGEDCVKPNRNLEYTPPTDSQTKEIPVSQNKETVHIESESCPVILPKNNLNGVDDHKTTSKSTEEMIVEDLYTTKISTESIPTANNKCEIKYDSYKPSVTPSDQKIASEIIANCINTLEENECM